MLDEGVLALLKVKSLEAWMVEKLEMERTAKNTFLYLEYST